MPFVALILFSCSSTSTEKESEILENEEVQNTQNFDWLLGKWQRTNDSEAGLTTYENWQKISETEYQGFGFALQNGDTVSQENMRLVQEKDNWFVDVSLPGEPNAVRFTLTDYNDSSFTCENEANDFPKIIHYWIDGKTLHAKIANSDMEIAYIFESLVKK